MSTNENPDKPSAWDAVKYEICFGGLSGIAAAGLAVAVTLETTILAPAPALPVIFPVMQGMVSASLAVVSAGCLYETRRKLRSIFQVPGIK